MRQFIAMISLKSYLVIILIVFSSACSIANHTEKSRLYKLNNAPDELVLKHLHYLSSDALNGRRIGTAGGKLAQDYIVRQLQFDNIKPLAKNYLSAFSFNSLFKSTQGHNVVGYIKGTEFPNSFIVLSAHFDHIGSQGSKIFNGADDNASGTAALLYYAKRLKESPLRYSVVLLFTDGEELNLKGANAFVKQNPQLLSNIVLNINLDMIAGTANTKHLRYISRGLDKVLARDKILALQQQAYPIQLKSGFRPSNRRDQKNIKWEISSDHGVFYRQKIPFIYYGVGNHKNYHQTTDSYENINQAFFIAAVAVIYHQIGFIDRNL